MTEKNWHILIYKIQYSALHSNKFSAQNIITLLSSFLWVSNWYGNEIHKKKFIAMTKLVTVVKCETLNKWIEYAMKRKKKLDCVQSVIRSELKKQKKKVFFLWKIKLHKIQNASGIDVKE